MSNGGGSHLSVEIFDTALAALTAHRWPGSVRELQNAVGHAVVIGSPLRIEADDLPSRMTAGADRAGGATLADMENRHILATFEAASRNISQAARALGVDRGTPYNKIEKYGLKRPRRSR